MGWLVNKSPDGRYLIGRQFTVVGTRAGVPVLYWPGIATRSLVVAAGTGLSMMCAHLAHYSLFGILLQLWIPIFCFWLLKTRISNELRLPPERLPRLDK